MKEDRTMMDCIEVLLHVECIYVEIRVEKSVVLKYSWAAINTDISECVNAPPLLD